MMRGCDATEASVTGWDLLTSLWQVTAGVSLVAEQTRSCGGVVAGISQDLDCSQTAGQRFWTPHHLKWRLLRKHQDHKRAQTYTHSRFRKLRERKEAR